jgi:hypothetical protein
MKNFIWLSLVLLFLLFEITAQAQTSLCVRAISDSSHISRRVRTTGDPRVIAHQSVYVGVRANRAREELLQALTKNMERSEKDPQAALTVTRSTTEDGQKSASLQKATVFLDEIEIGHTRYKREGRKLVIDFEVNSGYYDLGVERFLLGQVLIREAGIDVITSNVYNLQTQNTDRSLTPLAKSPSGNSVHQIVAGTDLFSLTRPQRHSLREDTLFATTSSPAYLARAFYGFNQVESIIFNFSFETNGPLFSLITRRSPAQNSKLSEVILVTDRNADELQANVLHGDGLWEPLNFDRLSRFHQENFLSGE